MPGSYYVRARHLFRRASHGLMDDILCILLAARAPTGNWSPKAIPKGYFLPHRMESEVRGVKVSRLP